MGVMAEIGNVACVNHGTFARLHHDHDRLPVGQPFHKLRVGHVGLGEADLVVGIVCNNVAVVFGQINANNYGTWFLDETCVAFMMKHSSYRMSFRRTHWHLDAVVFSARSEI